MRRENTWILARDSVYTKNLNELFIMRPLVAINCLVYNHEPYLRDCLEGFVMQQTNFPFVAIVHDDASTDHSADIIREYAAKYPDIIHPIYETENQWRKADGSLRKIMNAAIEATGAPYIAMCEGDDYWTDPYKLQKQVNFFDTHPNVGLCYTDCDIYYEDENRWERAIYTSAGETFNARILKISERCGTWQTILGFIASRCMTRLHRILDILMARYIFCITCVC